MDKKKIEDLMVPISEFMTVAESDSFGTAINCLAQIDANRREGKSRANLLLIVNSAGKVVSGVCPKHMLRGLEPSYSKALNAFSSEHVQGFGHLITSLREELDHNVGLWDNLCANTKTLSMGEIIPEMPHSQIIQEGESMNEAIHRFLLAGHNSLFVTNGLTLVGVLVFDEVFAAILEYLKDCDK